MRWLLPCYYAIDAALIDDPTPHAKTPLRHTACH
jgi:hypothetical protein